MRLFNRVSGLMLSVLAAFYVAACEPVQPVRPTSDAQSSVETSAPSPTSIARPTPTAVAQSPFSELVKTADPPGGHVTDIAFAPSDPSVVYLSCSVNAMGVWRSNDNGETWERIFRDENFDVTHTLVLAVDPTDSNFVLIGDVYGDIIRTTDGGKGWERVRIGGEPVFPLYALAFSPSRPNLVYAGDYEGKVLKSTNRGSTWNVIAQLPTPGIGSLAVDSFNPDTVYAAGRDGVYKSIDGGKTWNNILSGPEVVEVALAPTNAKRVVAATVQGVYLSTDGGNNWELTLKRHSHSVQISQTNPLVVYAGTNNGVYRSNDGGRNWLYLNNGIQFLDIGPLTIHPKDSDIVLIANNIWQWTYHYDPFPASTEGEGIYKTIDGGNTWKKSTAGFVDLDIIALAIDPNNTNVVYAGTEASRGLYRSNNGGASWVLILGGPQPDSFDIAHYTMRLATDKNSNVFMTGRFGITESTNQGETWIPMLVRRHFHGIGISPHNSLLIFTGTSPAPADTAHSQSDLFPGGRILRSSDGGLHWSEVGEGFPSGAPTSVHDFAFDPVDPNVVYVSTSSHETHGERTATTIGIYKSTDSGLTWMAVNNGLTNLNVDAIRASPKTSGLLYASTESGVFRSSDGGNTWLRTDLALPTESLLVDPVVPATIFAGTERGLYWSPDGGSTWQRVDSIPEKSVTDIATDPKGKLLFVVVNDVGIFKGERRQVQLSK